ncbi:MAG: SurA N-terminal domain-containing protein [Woeseiaceae bacterium]|nr:SurA N-terminal domain-containing protein [Woeseiaceae bacterium]
MLTKIREKFTGWIAFAILALIGIPFLFLGYGSYDFLGGAFAAKVDGSEISIGQFEQAYRNQMEANPALADLPEEFRLQIRQGVLEQLVRERLVDMHVIDQGYQISDDMLDRTIMSIPEFQLDGAYDEETANALLLQTGMTPAQFKSAQRNAMRTNQLQRAIAGSSIITPADYRRFLNLIAEQRLVSLASFDIESVAAGVDVTEEMITTFYDINDTMFLTEESADVEFIEVRRDVVAESVEISEDALYEYYLDNQDRYLQDEQRRARHILILSQDDADAAEAQANDLVARLESGESFETLAAENSDDTLTAANGGDLGVMTRTQLSDELGGAIFSMAVGDIEGPVRTDFGFHVVKLDEILDQGPLPLEQVRGELLSELRVSEAEVAFRDLEGQVSDALFDAPDIQSISVATGLEVQTATGFTRSGGEPIGSNQAAIDAVFDASVLLDGQISEIVELDANRSAIFKVSQRYEASRLPLEEVRDQIDAAIRAQEAQTIIFNRAERLLVALNNGEDFGAAAEAAGAAVSEPMLLGRQDTQVDQNVMAQVFTAKKPLQGAPTRGSVANSTGGITVFSLEAVLPGRPESIPLADRDAGKLELAAQAGTSEFIAFVEALYNRADIVISEDALAAQDLF